MKKIIFLFLLITMAIGSNANADRLWYDGVVTKITLNESSNQQANGFKISFNNNLLDDCRFAYVYVSSSVNASSIFYDMAVRSLSDGLLLGVMIDKDINGPGGVCNPTGARFRLQAAPAIN